MIVFRDRTFCTFYQGCHYGKKCPRALTPKVKADAEKWWTQFMNGAEDRGEPPISQWAEKPECFKGITE